ncbi:potassium-transporting ATPase subunit B [Streptomyces mashuensis]|uniref:Potassium-transporting ATPase subunit B n=1 Tax=Streptomyces mashuensis TaxID=33904 RepID=A0A919EGM7_9ACTN|nr:PP2C family protein-serine/threonine phosphatase [Streptomyces mashuensis]GHF73236.1 potassium-transporting ATPase subunit B [Streptomyces mashuensis]
MIPHTTTHHTLTGLSATVRRLARDLRLPVELRSRLALSVTSVASHEVRAGRPVRLDARPEPASDGGSPQLAVRLSAPHAPGPPRLDNLPLPAEPDRGGALWRLPTGAPAPAPAPGDDTPSDRALLEEELRAALARADALAADRERLRHELAETNSGVLALYVQLEERDERLRRAHGEILRELEDALRPQPPRTDGLELAVHYAPAGTDAPTGGDLYDWFLLPDGTVHITVVDALGHGITSTRSALTVTHAVRTLALEGHPLPAIVGRTAEILMPLDPDLMATVLLVRLDPATGAFTVANGSHPPALLTRADGSGHYLEARGRGVGYPLPGSDELVHDRLGPGDVLLLYTDGLTESRRDPREGEARLRRAVRRHRHLPIEDLPGAVAREMHDVILHADDTVALTARLAPRPAGG